MLTAIRLATYLFGPELTFLLAVGVAVKVALAVLL